METWKERAGLARLKVRAAKHGEKDIALLQIAGGKDANTVRRQIFALDFLDELTRSNPSLRQEVEHLSFSIIELLARWRTFDPKGALKAARDAAKGRYTVALLAEALANARKTGGIDFEAGSYRDRIASDAFEIAREILGPDVYVDQIASNESQDKSVDFHFMKELKTGSLRHKQSVAAIIVGPYQDSRLYRKRMREWLYRALGLSFFYNHVIVLLPLESELSSYRSWLAEAQVRMAKVDRSSEDGMDTAVIRWIPSIQVEHPNPWRHHELTDEEAEILKGLSILGH